MKAVFFPDSFRHGNPYLDLLEDGLNKAGVTIFHPDTDYPYRTWLATHRSEIDVLHFHWLHYYYNRKTRTESTHALFKFAYRLIIARLLGYRIVWTMHNLYPHERNYPSLDLIARILMVTFSHAIIVHCEKAQGLLEKKFKRRSAIHVIPLGPYPELSTRNVDCERVRSIFGIREGFLFFHFGLIRPYKGIEQLITTFTKISSESANLLIAGRSPFPEYSKRLDIFASQDSRVLFIPKRLDDLELHELLTISDVTVFPFRNILTSSSVVLAIAYGKPVVAPKLGCLPEYVSDDIGILYDPDNPNGLINALNESRKRDFYRKENAGKPEKVLSWGEIGKLTYQAYHG